MNAILEDLRRRIQLLETRPPAAGPRLPPHQPKPKDRMRDLGDIPGARPTSFGVVVNERLAPGARIGKVAPADALGGHADVIADLAGAPASLAELRILDIETTGLAGGTGTLAFVVGLGRFDAAGALHIEQLVLASPGAEVELVDHLLASLAGTSLLVTFNGRSFDAPLLRTRCILSRRAPGPLASAPHLDLLPAARRLWRARCGDSRLITLEERVLGRRRPIDIPGSLAPAAYASFLRTGEVVPVADIVAHNRDDIAGTAALLAAVLRAYHEPLTWAEDATELLALGEHRVRRHAGDGALPLLERALHIARAPSTRRRILSQLGNLHRRARRFDAARTIWERYRAEFPGENLGYSELAKLLEHRARNIAAALAVAEAAPHPGAADLGRRITRLHRRLGSGTLDLHENQP